MQLNTLYEFSTLDFYILKKINPQNIDAELNSDSFEQITQLIRIEVWESSQNIISKAHSLLYNEHIRSFICNHQAQLCYLIDQLFSYKKIYTGKYFSVYADGLLIIEEILFELLEILQNRFCNYFDFNANVPIISQLDQISVLKNKIKQIEVNNISVDPLLKEIILRPIKTFINSGIHQGITFKKTEYFILLLKQLELIKGKNDDISLTLNLVSINYNDSWFVKYLLKKIISGVNDESQPHKKLQVLMIYLKHFKKVEVQFDIAFSPKNIDVKTQILKWISEEIECIEKEISLIEKEKQNKQIDVGVKIQTGMSVAQLGYFLKLLVDCEVIKNTNQSDIIRFFSRYIITKQKDVVSPISLNAKFYKHEENNKYVVKEYLKKMINEANKKDYP